MSIVVFMAAARRLLQIREQEVADDRAERAESKHSKPSRRSKRSRRG
jgi:hypothetical protein